MEENALRLVLVIAGLVILAGIYFYDMLQKKKISNNESSNEVLATERVDPIVKTEPSFSAVFDENNVAEPVEEPEPVSISDSEPVVEKEEIPVALQALVIQLAVLPKAGGVLSGVTLLDAFTRSNLEFGDMGIFHCYERQNGVETQRFHVANILEPGTFPVGSMADFESTGIVLFFQTNNTVNAVLAFESMLSTAQQLTQVLDARLADETMNDLTLDKISALQTQLQDLSNL